jgi:plasmid maintenance system antidote protein VapI
MVSRGRQIALLGEQNGKAKLTVDNVLHIRELYDTGLSQQKIADEVGVHPTTVNNVLSGRCWGHVV